MESSQSSSFDPFISKKTLHSSSTPSPSDQTMTKAPDQSLCISKTPEKPINPQRRMKNRPAALSVKELTQAAKKFPKSDSDSPSRSDSIIGIAKQQNASWQSETAVSKSEMADGSIKLPEKYNLLDKFFNSLDSSIRLLRLKGSMPTFTNISPKIEYLTDRRFTYSHLAQLKFILPEVIEVKKVLTHDEQTSCMKPDLHVSLNADAIEDDGKLKSESVNSWLRKVFRSRLLHFSEAHPKGDEVPRGTLPHPFNQLKQDTHKNKIKATKSSVACEISSDALLEQQPAAAAGHLSQSFRRHFLQQGLNQEAVNTTQMPSIVSLRSSVLPVSDPYFDECSSRKEISAAATPFFPKSSSKQIADEECIKPGASATPFFPKSSSKQIADEECIKPGASATSLPPSHTATTPVKKIDSTMNEDYSPMGTVSIEGTPAKLISTPAKLMSVTPGLQPPKRCCMSPDDDSTRSPNILARRPPCSRSLKFDTPVKSAKFEDEVNDGRSISVDSDIFDILPENLLESIREKERKMLEDQDPAISQAKWRQQMITNLPKLFDSIHFVFQAISRSVITKEELMHKITASHLDIVDRREIEGQLRLLQELVPEWIYEKSVSSGDLLLCINKIISPESIHIRLAEAI